MELTDREFRLFRDHIQREVGIFLPEAKKALVVARLGRRLRTLNLPSFGAYYELVGRDHAEHTVMLDSICTNETRFFREPRQFEFLERDVLPKWRKRIEEGSGPRQIRAWSAACSTGEEPFSLAMLLRTHFPAADGWGVNVLASDISTKVLAAAREASWPIERAEDIPPDYRRAYMLKGIRGEEGRMRAQEDIRSLVEFRQVNLNEERYDVPGPFDLIFCRNVLIYFDSATKAAVIDRLATHLAPGGILFLGHSETLHGGGHALRHCGPTAYMRS
jgi:chemotaxis protein methyltransferase CheR